MHLKVNIAKPSSMNIKGPFLSALGAFLVLSPGTIHAQNSCEALKSLTLDRATIVSATLQEPTPFKMKLPPGLGLLLHVPEVTIPKRCEVKGIAQPTSDSEINFILWLPSHESWNGKYMQRGNGGWAGALSTDTLVPPLMRGYATAATDDGHHEMHGARAADFAIGHPEKLIDFGYRAVHQTAKLSKEIIEAYYGKAAGHHYFFGCSDGGREALMEAQRFPEDFDGIIAGAPANDWTHLFDGFAWDEVAVNAKPESRFTVEQLSTIEKAALGACDMLDGVKDGVIDDPRQCHFDPQMLLCQGAVANDCLTQPQIDAVKKIYAGPKDPKTG
jgi:feruloyl esterase